MTQTPMKGQTTKSILDHSLRYTDTDLRRTFARIRREQREQAPAQVERENLRNVFALNERKRAAGS
jgi:hypothetical protein